MPGCGRLYLLARSAKMSTSNRNKNTKTPTNTKLYKGDIYKHTSTISCKDHSPPQYLKSQPSLATLCQALQCASCILSLPISLQASAPAPLGLSEGWDTHTAMHFCFTLGAGGLCGMWRGLEGVWGDPRSYTTAQLAPLES